MKRFFLMVTMIFSIHLLADDANKKFDNDMNGQSKLDMISKNVTQIQNLTNEVSELKSRISSLESRLNALEGAGSSSTKEQSNE
jgi:cell division septum initiation protein DivIVA